MDSVPLKVCSGCKRAQPRSEFCKNSSAKDGLNWYCRECSTKKKREWTRKNRERSRETQRKWREENLDYARERARRYFEENRDYINEQQRRRYQENPEKEQQYNRDYRAQDPELARQKEREYYAKTKERRRKQAREKYQRIVADPEQRARKFAAELDRLHQRRAKGGSRAQQDRTELAQMLRAAPCSYCGTTPAGEIDHVVPLSAGGLHEAENLTSACRTCNGSKRDKDLLSFLLYRRDG